MEHDAFSNEISRKLALVGCILCTFLSLSILHHCIYNYASTSPSHSAITRFTRKCVNTRNAPHIHTRNAYGVQVSSIYAFMHAHASTSHTHTQQSPSLKGPSPRLGTGNQQLQRTDHVVMTVFARAAEKKKYSCSCPQKSK